MAIRYYCGNCGHETEPDAQIYPNCGRLHYQAARDPTLDSDAPTPQPISQPYSGTRPNERVRSLLRWFLDHSLMEKPVR